MHSSSLESLREQAMKYRMLFEQATDAIFLVDGDMLIDEVNDAAAELLGYAPDELVGRPVAEIVDPQSLAAKPLLLEELAAGGVVTSTRMLVRQDGSTVETEVRAKGMPDGGFQSIVIPIGDQLRVEQEQKRHALMFETLLDGVIFADAEGRITDWNPAAERMYGYAREEVIGKRPTFLHAPEHSWVLDSIIAGVTRDGHWSNEINFIRSDGSRGWSETVVVAVRDAEGNVVGSMGVNRDITERRAATDAIAASNRQRDLILESAGEGIWGIGADGNVTFVNPAAERMLGWTAEELLGRSPHELVHHTHVDGSPYPRADCPIYRSLQDGTACRVDDDVFWRRDGSSFPVTYTSTPMVANGAVTGVVVVFSDESMQRELAEQLRQSQKIEAVGRFAGGIAHDFNNILTAVGGYTDMLEPLQATAEGRALVQSLQTTAARAATLTTQLLAFTRQQVLEPVLLDVNGVVEETRAMLGRLMPDSVRVVATLDPGLPSVKADPMQVTQVLLNLALNARDAMPAGGELAISTSRAAISHEPVLEGVDLAPGDYVRLSVADNGVGMPAAVASRVFDPFFTTKPVGEGTGLGLATVYGIVKQSGGYVFVRSQQGEGTTFDVYLPATAGAPAQEARSEPRVPSTAGGGRILLVEDEDVVRELILTALVERGHEVVPARTGDEAIASLAANSGFDVVVTDVVMPGSSGRDVAAAARVESPDARVIFMSGYAADIVDTEALEGQTAFLQKPFSMRELVAKVDEVLAERVG